VGIRAHDFLPVSPAEGPVPGKPNRIRIRVRRRSEEPFEEVVLFINAASPQEGEELWWKYSKYTGLGELPEWLYIPPGAVLLLCQ
jgi:hypothetical protein